MTSLTRGLCWGSPCPPHRPVLVSTMMAAAQHLKEASTAPMAVTSVGSRVRGAARRSSSNSCRWYTAASASLAICKHQEVRLGRGAGPGRDLASGASPYVTSTYLVLHHHGLHRKAALGSFPRQHDTVCAVQHGIGHVTRLCPSRPGLTNHALQHLGGIWVSGCRSHTLIREATALTPTFSACPGSQGHCHRLWHPGSSASLSENGGHSISS